MFQRIQTGQPEEHAIYSIGQPGALLDPSLPKPLDGVLVKTVERVGGQKTFSEKFKGMWIIDEKDTRPVCLKMLPESDSIMAKERLRRQILMETQIWKKAVHPNIFPFIGYQDIEGDTYLVFPWAERGSLDMFLAGNPQLPAKERLKLLLGAAHGLAYLHTQTPSIIHGDLNPAHILINSDLKAALYDFGYSLVVASLGIRQGMTTASGSIGTAGYQAPEITLGAARPSTQSDVYAMAGVILETMSGKAPFWQLKSAAAVYLAIAFGKRCQPCDHPALPEEDPIWSFLGQCWDTDVEVRPSAQGVIEELERSLSHYANPAPSHDTVGTILDFNFIQELASLESISMPSTEHIIDLILALAKTAPTATRNKHQLYRILIISRDLCYHHHRLAHTGGESSSGLDVLEQCWEIMDNLESTLLELFDIVSQEAVPFGALSLATWNTSRTGLRRIYGKLTAPPFNTCRIDDSANETRDRYFDDCSWLSLLLFEGIEIPVQGMHPGVDEEGVFIEARNVIERLNHVVNEAKLNGNTDEPTRELFIKILSDLADAVMSGPENLSADFWNAAAGALQDIDLEKDLNQGVVDSLRDSWGRFVDRQIQQVPAPRAPTPAPSQGPIVVSLPQELTRLDHEITPAAEPLVLLLLALGREAPTVTRNKHKIYSIISRARDICNDILAIGVRTAVGGLETLDEYYNLIDALEGILLDVARLLPAEQVSFGREMCVSWPESREEFHKILNRLHEPSFRLDPSAPKQELTNSSVFDDHYWLSLLLEEGIEKELGRQYVNIEMAPALVSVREGLRYLENEIKCGHPEGTTREIVVGIATRLYEALSASVSEKGNDTELPIRSAEPPPAITLNKNTLVAALSIAFSVLDLDSSLESQDIHRLAGNWWGISHFSPTRHSGNLDETKLAETVSSSQVEPEGQEDQETSQDQTKGQNYWRQLHKIISRRNLAYSEEMVPRDKVGDENWIVTIHIAGEDVDTLRLTGAGLSKREAKDAVARLALIVFGEIVGEE